MFKGKTLLSKIKGILCSHPTIAAIFLELSSQGIGWSFLSRNILLCF